MSKNIDNTDTKTDSKTGTTKTGTGDYIVFKSGSQQFRAQTGDVVKMEQFGVESGEHQFNEVLLVKTNGDIKVGNPNVEGVSVKATVLGLEKQKKVVSFKHKKRKTHRNKTGHRQELVKVRIDSF